MLKSCLGTGEVSFSEDGIGEVCASDVCTDEFCTCEVLTFEIVASEIFTGKVLGHDFTQGDNIMSSQLITTTVGSSSSRALRSYYTIIISDYQT